MKIKVSDAFRRLIEEVPLECLSQALGRGPVEPADALDEVHFKAAQHYMYMIGVPAPHVRPASDFDIGLMTLKQYEDRVQALTRATKDPLVERLARAEYLNLSAFRQSFASYRGCIELTE